MGQPAELDIFQAWSLLLVLKEKGRTYRVTQTLQIALEAQVRVALTLSLTQCLMELSHSLSSICQSGVSALWPGGDTGCTAYYNCLKCAKWT